jgi:hypothetical protein
LAALCGANCIIEGRESAVAGAPAVVLCGAQLSNLSGFSSVSEGNPDWFACAGASPLARGPGTSQRAHPPSMMPFRAVASASARWRHRSAVRGTTSPLPSRP